MTLVERAEIFSKKYILGDAGSLQPKAFFDSFFFILYLEDIKGKFVYNFIYQQGFQ